MLLVPEINWYQWQVPVASEIAHVLFLHRQPVANNACDWLVVCWCIFASVSSDAAYADNESNKTTDQRRAKYNFDGKRALWCTESSDELVQRATAGLRSKKSWQFRARYTYLNGTLCNHDLRQYEVANFLQVLFRVAAWRIANDWPTYCSSSLYHQKQFHSKVATICDKCPRLCYCLSHWRYVSHQGRWLL